MEGGPTRASRWGDHVDGGDSAGNNEDNPL